MTVCVTLRPHCVKTRQKGSITERSWHFYECHLHNSLSFIISYDISKIDSNQSSVHVETSQIVHLLMIKIIRKSMTKNLRFVRFLLLFVIKRKLFIAFTQPSLNRILERIHFTSDIYETLCLIIYSKAIFFCKWVRHQSLYLIQVLSNCYHQKAGKWKFHA